MAYTVKIVDAGKDVKDTSLKPYEYSLLLSKNTLKEKSSGVTDTDVAHGVTGGFPLCLTFPISGDSVSAAADARIDATDLQLAANKFYRIFENKQST